MGCIWFTCRSPTRINIFRRRTIRAGGSAIDVRGGPPVYRCRASDRQIETAAGRAENHGAAHAPSFYRRAKRRAGGRLSQPFDRRAGMLRSSQVMGKTEVPLSSVERPRVVGVASDPRREALMNETKWESTR